MREDEMKEMIKRFEEFKTHLPEHVKFPKAGPNGQDVILPKEFINGVLVYSADVEVPFIGLGISKSRITSKHEEYWSYLYNLFQYLMQFISKRRQ